MNTPDEYLLVIRMHTDALKARSELPEYRYSQRLQDKLKLYFILRAADMGEASFRVGNILLPQFIFARILCEDFILFFWVCQSEANAAEYAKTVRSEWIRTARILFDAGRAGVRHTQTGQDHTKQVLDALRQEIVPRMNVEQIAKDVGLSKVYDVVFRCGSLPVHAKTFDTMLDQGDDAGAFAAPFSVITGMLRVMLDVLEKGTSADDVLRRLAIEKLGGN
jgi:hypothetical protein